jgi:hypothetical protein
MDRYRMTGLQIETGNQDIEGMIECGVGVIEPGAARIIRAIRQVTVIAGLGMSERRLILRQDLTAGPESEHQRQEHPAGHYSHQRFAAPSDKSFIELISCHSTSSPLRENTPEDKKTRAIIINL